MSKNEELITYIVSLTPEQVDKVIKHLPSLEQMIGTSEDNRG